MLKTIDFKDGGLIKIIWRRTWNNAKNERRYTSQNRNLKLLYLIIVMMLDIYWNVYGINNFVLKMAYLLPYLVSSNCFCSVRFWIMKCVFGVRIFIFMYIQKIQTKNPNWKKKTEIPLTCSICFLTTYLIRLQKMIGGIEYHFYYQVHIQ